MLGRKVRGVEWRGGEGGERGAPMCQCSDWPQTLVIVLVMKLLQIVFLQHTKVIIKDKKKNQRERERESWNHYKPCNLSSTPGSAPQSLWISLARIHWIILAIANSEYNNKTNYYIFLGIIKCKENSQVYGVNYCTILISE